MANFTKKLRSRINTTITHLHDASKSLLALVVKSIKRDGLIILIVVPLIGFITFTFTMLSPLSVHFALSSIGWGTFNAALINTKAALLSSLLSFSFLSILITAIQHFYSRPPSPPPPPSSELVRGAIWNLFSQYKKRPAPERIASPGFTDRRRALSRNNDLSFSDDSDSEDDRNVSNRNIAPDSNSDEESGWEKDWVDEVPSSLNPNLTFSFQSGQSKPNLNSYNNLNQYVVSSDDPRYSDLTFEDLSEHNEWEKYLEKIGSEKATPDHMLDPITRLVMPDPVTMSDKQNYNSLTAKFYIASGNDSPTNRQRFQFLPKIDPENQNEPKLYMHPNHALRKEIVGYILSLETAYVFNHPEFNFEKERPATLNNEIIELNKEQLEKEMEQEAAKNNQNEQQGNKKLILL